MKYILFLMALCFVCPMMNASPRPQKIKGSGIVKEEVRKIGSFHTIDVSSIFDVYLIQEKNTTLKIEAESNILPYIHTKTQNGRLKIYITPGSNIEISKGAKIYVSTPRIEKIFISGAASVTSKSLWEMEDLTVDISAAGKLFMSLKGNRIDIDLSAAGEATLEGNVRTLWADLSGASKLRGAELEVSKARVDISGAGEGKLIVNEELSVDLSGASKFFYEGAPEITNLKVSGGAVLKSKINH